ncbi:hypothetical protein SN811_08920 [Ligilactobacillus agilis]|uniref:Uncharacterized protein n=1 Tax=Ligilactobacillus agilis TaxID=1601 RepID=A0A6F9Y4I5_9LACO|nr:hypothetical protein [Ligilactobacillus agilis]GET12392.1 hypothetical protein SN811_08920 [Ligilactobacillus agilis]
MEADILEYKLKDDVTQDDVLTLKQYVKSLNEVLDVLNRDLGNGYRDKLNEKRVLREMSFVKMQMQKLADEIPPAQITILEK